MTLEKFSFQTYHITPKINAGGCGRIIALSDSHVAKVLHSEISQKLEEEMLSKELDVLTQLYDSGISVPKPEGIFIVEVRNLGNWYGLFGKSRKGLIMERLYGKSGNILRGKKRKRAEELFAREIEKCRAKGFTALDGFLYNSVYDHKIDKLYLCDFYHWEKGITKPDDYNILERKLCETNK